MHLISNPAILYFGTPVVLVTTVNDDGTYNIAPISSAFWLGWRCVIGMGTAAKTVENLMRTKECVLNLPSVHEVAHVNKLALTTGADPVPESKRRKGYRTERDKFGAAELTAVESWQVDAPRIAECPVHLEAKVAAIHGLANDDEQKRERMATIELKIIQVHADDSILMDGNPDKIDPDKWRPLMMSFQQFYGLSKQVHTSALATISEHLYR